MESLRVNTGIKIEVNDEGETILIDTENALFREKYQALIDNLDVISKDMESVNTDGMTEEDFHALYVEKMREIMAELDKVFGIGSCRKIFGDIVPSIVAVGELFEQLNPIVLKYAKAREEKINKNYMNRKGGKKK